MTLDRCSVNLMKVFLFGIKDRLNMKRIRVSLEGYFSVYSCKCTVIKIFKSIDLL